MNLQLQIKQINHHLKSVFFPHIDVQDLPASYTADAIENACFSRSLVGVAALISTDCSIEEACDCIVDGFDDNGIDGIYYNSSERCLYLIQAKYHSDGNGSIELGDLNKFIQGIKDLTNAKYDRFNSRIQNRSAEINNYLLDSQTRFCLVLVYTGKDKLSVHCDRIIQDFLDANNDISEIFELNVIDVKSIYSHISAGVQGKPINLDIALSNWSHVAGPLKAFYGQVAASDISSWCTSYGRQLFSQNIRVYLRNTEVNTGISETIRHSPEMFWYYNNGITALCDDISKKPIGGMDQSSGVFVCRNLKIVNGAQTVGAIHSMRTLSGELARTKVWIRIISLGEGNQDIAKTITKTNNTQNKIEKRDFVSLDPEQKRIFDELLIEKIIYLYKSGETINPSEDGFDLNEATIVRACLQNDIQYTIQVKREISKLWDDIEKAPYKLLFNRSITGPKLWKEIQILRAVEKFIIQKKKKAPNREKLMITHGNRFFLHLVFQKLGDEIYQDKKLEIPKICKDLYQKMVVAVNASFPDAQLGSLFKNLTKCRAIKSSIDL